MFWGLSGDAYEETRWLAQLLPHRHALAPDLHLACLLTFHRAAWTMQEFQSMDRWTEEVMALLPLCEDKLLHAFAWSLMPEQRMILTRRPPPGSGALPWRREAGEKEGSGLEYGAISDQNFVLGNYLQWYAVFLIEQGELARAAPLAAEGLERAQTQGDPWGISDGYGVLGRLALLGDLGRAQRCFYAAVTIATTFNIRQGLCMWQPFLGIVTLYGGNAPGSSPAAE